MKVSFACIIVKGTVYGLIKSLPIVGAEFRNHKNILGHIALPEMATQMLDSSNELYIR